ncbi:MAG: GNAT family N-acetyltransferase [Lachnospiraceae bacterium]|nr:GNAT family N-acetyltransferase [Lachnospiraceae bacterium]
MIKVDHRDHKQDLYNLWQRNFRDPEEYAKFYFENVYGHNQVLLNENEEGELRGTIHFNPYELILCGREVRADYIVGVATDEEYRRQGVMRELLKEGFHRMRDQGRVFTYLMPADENYYLPFDFRFGMNRIEQEISVIAPDQLPKPRYTYTQRLEGHQVKEVCAKENLTNIQRFAVTTKITPEYLSLLARESVGDLGFLYYVMDGDDYLGRFEMAEENGCMILSRIFVSRMDHAEEFLRDIISFAEEKYHFGYYQLILDENFDGVCKLGAQGGLRAMPPKMKKIIMFRILNLDKLGDYLSLCEPVEGCRIRVEDPFLTEQSGTYYFETMGDRVKIVRTQEEADSVITIGDLTEVIFGEKRPDQVESAETLSEGAKHFLGQIEPLRKNCIMEIV